MGTLTLADLCAERNIHCTVYATGCIYSYDEKHALGSGVGFTEDDKPNFDGSWYSETKAYVERMMRMAFPKTLILRVRMPISDDLNPRSFVTKIMKYERIVDIPNSMTVLSPMLPVSLKMAANKEGGVWNFCNPGVMCVVPVLHACVVCSFVGTDRFVSPPLSLPLSSHNEIMELVKKYVRPDLKWQNFTEEEQSKILKAGRSNNELDCSKLVGAYPEVEEIHVAMEKCIQKMGEIEGKN